MNSAMGDIQYFELPPLTDIIKNIESMNFIEINTYIEDLYNIAKKSVHIRKALSEGINIIKQKTTRPVLIMIIKELCTRYDYSITYKELVNNLSEYNIGKDEIKNIKLSFKKLQLISEKIDKLLKLINNYLNNNRKDEFMQFKQGLTIIIYKYKLYLNNTKKSDNDKSWKEFCDIQTINFQGTLQKCKRTILNCC
jgi:hypothetical protein